MRIIAFNLCLSNKQNRSREFVLRLSWEACENICGNKKQINDKSTKAITNAAFKWYSFYRNLSFAADKNIIFRFITVWNLTLKVELIYLLHLWLDLDYPKRCKTVLAIICYLLFAYVLISHTPFPSAPPPPLILRSEWAKQFILENKIKGQRLEMFMSTYHSQS